MGICPQEMLPNKYDSIDCYLTATEITQHRFDSAVDAELCAI